MFHLEDSGSCGGHFYFGIKGTLSFWFNTEITSALQERLKNPIFGYEALPNSLLNSVIKWYHDRHHWDLHSSYILRSPNILNALAIALISYTQPEDKINVESSKLTVNKNNALSNVAMESAYQYDHSWLASVIDYLEENLNHINLILKEIPQVEIIQPQGTFLAWLDFRKLNLNHSELMAFLKQVGLVLSSGKKYGQNGAGFARLNFACNRNHLINALHKLKQQ